jgi:hypothetical protein
MRFQLAKVRLTFLPRSLRGSCNISAHRRRRGRLWRLIPFLSLLALWTAWELCDDC